MKSGFCCIELRVVPKRFESWAQFTRETPEYSIGLEVMDDTPGHRGHWVHFDHHAGVVREVTMSAAMQAYLAVRQGHLMQRWLQHRRRIPVYVWNADQDVCLAAFILEYHEVLERLHNHPLLRWIVQFNNKIDVCGGVYPVDLEELVRNHFTWVFEPYRRQRMKGKSAGDEALVKTTIRQVCNRLEDLLMGRAGPAPITATPELLYESPLGFVIADEKGDPNSRLVLASQGYTNLISLVSTRKSGRYTYSVIRGSPYDEDFFQVPRLFQAFQQAEDRPDAKIWGGSNMAGGSDSELGSSLHWTRLRDIAEPIVAEARCAAGVDAPRAIPDRPRILLVTSDRSIAGLRQVLEDCGAQVVEVASCAAAAQSCRAPKPFQAIFASPAVSDGDYHDLIHLAHLLPDVVPVILCLPEADGGWTDLLETGAAALLAPPYRRPDVIRLFEALPRMAAHQAHNELLPLASV